MPEIKIPDPKIPEGSRLDPDSDQPLAALGIWYVILADGRRTAWNGDNGREMGICPACGAEPDKMPDCKDCAGTGEMKHVPYADRPWDEIVPGLWLGGHDCQMTGAPNGEAIPGDTFDMVVSLYTRYVEDSAAFGGLAIDTRFQPVEGVIHHRHRMADAELNPEHHDAIDALADQIKIALGDGLKVLVRCQAGLNRSALVTGLALLRMGYTADEAIAKMRAARSPYVLFNQSFVRYLRAQESER